MTTTTPTDEILDWSAKKLTPWKQDALRRLATAGSVSTADLDELFLLLKAQAGFMVSGAPAPLPLDRSHLASAMSAGPSLTLKAIRNVQNVNRLKTAAELTFALNSLTVIYGRNGSGKSGFVRIFRTACRTRHDNPAKLKVLSDVYGAAAGPASAEIVIDSGAGDEVIAWQAGSPAADRLLQVAVFDSAAAQVYVDAGNQIQFLPFGLALPHRLNDVCLRLRERLEAERQANSSQLALATITFPARQSKTEAQKFYTVLSGSTTDANIIAATVIDGHMEVRRAELARLLAKPLENGADIEALAAWAENLATDAARLQKQLDDAALEHYAQLWGELVSAQSAAALDASALFAADPLPGIGADVWRRLWLTARDYSLEEAYRDREFPVLTNADEPARCVLCHQQLNAEAADRLMRFQTFIAGTLARAVDTATAAATAAHATLPDITRLRSADFSARVAQVRARDATLGDLINRWITSAVARYTRAVAILTGQALAEACDALPDVTAALKAFSAGAASEAKFLVQAADVAGRAAMQQELAELEDRKILSLHVDRLKARRDLLAKEALYSTALADANPAGITKKANDLIDTHLTEAVRARFDAERETFEINHLKVSLTRKSGQTKAHFQTDPGTSMVRSTAEFLSEGEQRALALAAFLTEVGVTEGAGPIVIDDPVSSLDRQRGQKVAARLVEEAQGRQVIVFTHDLIFFNDICREADRRGVPCATTALFSDTKQAGQVDPAGVIWQGLPVKKRLNLIKQDFAPLRKLHQTSPGDYERHLKNLYGRLRDTYERIVEECLFQNVIRRGVDRVETQKLRMVQISDAIANRFHVGMTKANTFSHDNPESETVVTPKPEEFEKDLMYIQSLIDDIAKEAEETEKSRPLMKTNNRG